MSKERPAELRPDRYRSFRRAAVTSPTGGVSRKQCFSRAGRPRNRVDGSLILPGRPVLRNLLKTTRVKLWETCGRRPRRRRRVRRPYVLLSAAKSGYSSRVCLCFVQALSAAEGGGRAGGRAASVPPPFEVDNTTGARTPSELSPPVRPHHAFPSP